MYKALDNFSTKKLAKIAQVLRIFFMFLIIASLRSDDHLSALFCWFSRNLLGFVTAPKVLSFLVPTLNEKKECSSSEPSEINVVGFQYDLWILGCLYEAQVLKI